MPLPRFARRLAFVVALTAAAPLTAQSAPPIRGIAHVAFAVHDIAASTAFYRSLGFEVAFHLGEGPTTRLIVLKITDRQFLELYPASPAQPTGLLHLCLDTDTAEGLHDFYAQQRNLHPGPVAHDGAGNLLFTLQGPSETRPHAPARPQPIEYTQYLPGSAQASDVGRDLGPNRIADELLGVGIPYTDRSAARDFFLGQLGFDIAAGRPWTAEIPSPSTEDLLLETANDRARLYLHVATLSDTSAELARRHIPAHEVPGAIEITDPDGNPIELESAHLLVAIGSAAQ